MLLHKINFYHWEVGDGSDGQKCTPFVSVYSDCTEDNKCTGCHKCTCSAEGKWVCKTITEACGEDGDRDIDMEEEQRGIDNQMLDSALNEMLEELQEKKQNVEQGRMVPAPRPRPPPQTSVIDTKRKINLFPKWGDSMEDESIKELVKMFRKKRSAEDKDEEEKKGNDTIVFHHTVDEMNEDTLQNTNSSGTLQAPKIDLIPMVSRRAILGNNTKPLQIEYTSPIHSLHAADNKVDTSAIHDDQVDLLVHHKIFEMIGNQSHSARDKDLSKLVVNELKGGQTEIIGDDKSPVVSNITFRPENDTLTAMAFIAGNLLNKLWNMEKDSEDSLETENMKHKKIDDLLELFKEPLNLRQETFLKNALEQLSKAIENQSIGNVSVCKNIEELKKATGISHNPKPVQPMLRAESFLDKNNSTETNKLKINEATAAAAALNKIGRVLGLIKRYEQTQNILNDINNNPNLKSNVKNKSYDGFSEDDQTTLNVFGDIVESLTKLLMPNKVGKNVKKGVKSKNFLSNDQIVKDRFKNINLTDVSMTTKDKIVLDYITHIRNNPSCIFNKHKEKLLLPKIEGDILLNLSEFFKIKSMSDLIKLVDSDSRRGENVMRTNPTLAEITTTKQSYTAHVTSTATTIVPSIVKENKSQFESAKEKLKEDLKNILEDLMKLQNITGRLTSGNKIDIVKALPCIYNLINNKEIVNNSKAKVQQKLENNIRVDRDSVTKVTQIIKNLKKELNNTIKTRRTYGSTGNRPNSAIIWERTIKNLGNKHKKPIRRNLDDDATKSFAVLKSNIENIENKGSKLYKSIAYLADIPVAERLLLLKTLALDTKKHISIFNDIKETIETNTEVPFEYYQTISEFIENAHVNINLNEKVLSKMYNLKKENKENNREIGNNDSNNIHFNEDVLSNHKLQNEEMKPFKMSNVFKSAIDTQLGTNTVKLTRNQILNQLIRNRIINYLKLKDGAGDGKKGINISLAKKILFYLEIGKDNLARDMFKIFMTHNTKNTISSPNGQASDFTDYEINQATERRLPQVPTPLIQFEDTKANDKTSWIHQEQLIEQLMNIKNTRF